MYPLEAGQTFPLDQWYVAARSPEVGREPFERTICNEPLVFYRTEAGDPVIMQGRCPHRFYPLAQSPLVGDTIQCGYHGMRFGPDGRCVEIPTQDKIPEKCRTRVYPTVERWQWIWVWMGDPALADPAAIPQPVYFDDPDWESTPAQTLHVKARYQLALDNLFDLSHLGYIHQSLVGDVSELVQTPVEMTEHNGILRMVRRTKNTPYSPYYTFLFGPGDYLVDTDVFSDYYGCSLVITGGPFFRAAGPNQPEASRKKLGEMCFLHAITPETSTTTFYFGGFTRDFRLEDDAFTAANIHMYDSVRAQDETALALVENGLDGLSYLDQEFSALQDSGAIRVRRLLSAQIRNENEKRQGKPSVLHKTA